MEEFFGSFSTRFGSFILAAALLYAAHKIHGSHGRIKSNITQTVGVIFAFLAGCAFLVTFIGDWASSLATSVPWLPAAALVVLTAIIAVDWLNNSRPDKPVFVSMLLLPTMLVLGMSQMGALWDQVGEGASRVGDQVEQVGE